MVRIRQNNHLESQYEFWEEDGFVVLNSVQTGYLENIEKPIQK